jgi:hypothetical protein
MENKTHSEHKYPLPLIINGKEYKWDHQYIKGEQIKKLGEIPISDELFLKVKDGYKDELIKDNEEVDLARPGIDHFYSKKPQIIIFVNTREEHWHEAKITYDQVVKLAFPDYNPNNPNVVYTVTYKRGPHQNPEGSMVKGESVFVQNKMIFNVTKTDKS